MGMVSGKPQIWLAPNLDKLYAARVRGTILARMITRQIRKASHCEL